MNDKRRDSKNRILRTGESQDSNGRYKYRFWDIDGRRKSIYSWKLVATDPVPFGKRNQQSLREMEAEINRDLCEDVLVSSEEVTVLRLVEKYVSLRTGVKPTTRAGYNTVIHLLEKEPFGRMPVKRVRRSDAKAWLVKLQQVDGKSYSTIHTIRGVVRPAFQMAVDDDFIRKNPFAFQIVSLLINDTGTREAISNLQERTFLDFVKNDTHYCRYYDGFYILFKTGLRISEFTGLTISDIDMEKRLINVNHQLQRVGNQIYVSTTKTNAGTRILPMSDDVYEAFKRILEKRPKQTVEPMIDGYSGFLFIDKDGHPSVGLHWEHYFKFVVEKYNRTHQIQLPKITPHVCRHTYCSNMAKLGMNPKVLQYLMGHSDISVTLNTYTHLKLEDATAELKNLVKKQADLDQEMRKLGIKEDEHQLIRLRIGG
ncbi:MAG: site-specific integrase [Lachnospiraceae bacterium]|nr:site-specific integrase [Lachnospiraceae bacterium]